MHTTVWKHKRRGIKDDDMAREVRLQESLSVEKEGERRE